MTYSIVARDPDNGQLGIAVQSHYFSTGSVVTWAEAGVGAVATQSMANPDYGPQGLALMRARVAAPAALRALVEADAGREVRQVAMIDATGAVAAHTGDRCIAAAGHILGEGFTVQANMMVDEMIWPAMRDAFVAATGPLAERLLAALDAAQAAGGDIRGQQSAALLVVEGERRRRPWRGVVVELRVEDHPRPLDELRRLLRMHTAYRLNAQGDEALAAGRIDEAMQRYAESSELAPDNEELRFWAAITLFRNGREADARPMLDRVFAKAPGFAALVPRLTSLGLLKDEDVQRIVGGRAP